MQEQGGDYWLPASLAGDTATGHVLMKLADELKLKESFS